MKKILISILSIIIVFVIFSQISLAQEAQEDLDPNSISGKLENVRGESGYSEADKYSALDLVASIIKAVLSFLGIGFLILTLYSGFQWLMSGGNEEVISKAKKRIKNSIIGFLIVALSYTISMFIFNIIIP